MLLTEDDIYTLRTELSWIPVGGGAIQGMTYDRTFDLPVRTALRLVEWVGERRQHERRQLPAWVWGGK